MGILGSSKKAIDAVIEQVGVKESVQRVAEVKNSLDNIQDGTANPNQQGLDGMVAIMNDAAIASTGLNIMITGTKLGGSNTYAMSARAYLTGHSFMLNTAIATTSIPLATALYKEGRYSDAVSILLSGASAGLGLINDVNAFNSKVTPLEAKLELGQLFLSLAAMAENEYKLTDKAVEKMSYAIEDLFNGIENLSAKLDGRDPSLGKAILEKLLPITKELNKTTNEIENNIAEFANDIKESAQELMKSIDDLSAKIDGRDPSLGKSILEKLLPITKELNKITKEIENNIAEFAEDIKESAQELMEEIDDFFAKIDGRDPSWGKLILEKLLKLTDNLNNGFNWFEEKLDWLPDDFKEWLELNRSGKFHIYDPLVLDLDGDGIELLKANGWNGVQFDYNGDGIKSSTGWVKSDDGLLVWDRNGDGKINNGSEIFGEDMFPQKINHNISNTSSGSNSTSGGRATVSGAPSNTTPIIENDGFYALSQLDSNQDGVIDANDANFNQIKVWRDLNQDGISQTGELFILNELDIQSINLNTGNTKNNTAGNSIGKSSTYTKIDGSNGKIADINFTLDTVHSEYIEHITIGEEQMLLPYLHGVGKLRDLREAATLSPELTNLLQEYKLATQKEQQIELIR